MSPKTKIITVVGSLNTDLVTYTPRIPQTGETRVASSFQTGPGGKGANQAVACARASRYEPGHSGHNRGIANDIQVKMMGSVGADDFGKILKNGLDQNGVDVETVKEEENTESGVAVVLVETTSGDNRILITPGANALTVLFIIQEFGEPIPVLLNPAPAILLPTWAYAKLQHLILNETEAAILSGLLVSAQDESSLLSVCQTFHKRGCPRVVVTLGASGAFYSYSLSGANHPSDGDVEQEHGLIPALSVDVVDTTAAGDTFVGVYAVAAVQENFTMRQAVRRAVAASSLSVQRLCAQASMPWLN